MGWLASSNGDKVAAKVDDAADSLASLAGAAKETATAAVKATAEHAKDLPGQVGDAAQHLADQAGHLIPGGGSRRGSWGVAALVLAALVGFVIWRRARS